MPNRVVITGIGLVTPLASAREASWQRLCAGDRAVRHITVRSNRQAIETIGAPAELRTIAQPQPVAAGRLSDPVSAAAAETRPAANSFFNAFCGGMDRQAPVGWAGSAGDEPDRLLAVAEAAVNEAMEHAGLSSFPRDPEANRRFGCSIGNSKGSLPAALAALDQLDVVGAIDPRLWTMFQPSTLSSYFAAKYGIGGPSRCPVAACATGLASVIAAALWIEDGVCDLALAGSADASLHPMVLGSYLRMGVLAPSDTDPQSAIKPFDARRAGFAIGEGAGMFVLESEEHALCRGADIIAVVAGWGQAADSCGITALSERPDSLEYCLKTAIRKAGLKAGDIDHVNTHATATTANDPWETAGIRAAFGADAGMLSVTANKSMIGHLLGAAGSVELAATVLAVRDDIVPPTMNWEERDAKCDLNCTPGRAVKREIRAAVKESIGFGGHVAAVVVKKA